MDQEIAVSLFIMVMAGIFLAILLPRHIRKWMGESKDTDSRKDWP